MSHFTVGVIVPLDTTPENLEARVAERMAKYDENMEVEPYRFYMNEDDVKTMAEYYKIDPADAPSLIRKMNDWNGAKEAGVDEQGVWYTRTYNSLAKWDWWVIGGRWNNGLKNGSNFCKVSELSPDDQFFAIVTNDGEWHQRAQMGWWGMTSDEKEPEKWDAERAEILSAHRDYGIVLVDAHI